MARQATQYTTLKYAHSSTLGAKSKCTTAINETSKVYNVQMKGD